MVISDHETVDLSMELRMREETKWRYDFNYEQREDSAWLSRIKYKED